MNNYIEKVVGLKGWGAAILDGTVSEETWTDKPLAETGKLDNNSATSKAQPRPRNLAGEPRITVAVPLAVR